MDNVKELDGTTEDFVFRFLTSFKYKKKYGALNH